MSRSLKERTLVGTSKTYWQEVDEYYRKKGRLMRLDDVNECLENKRSIEQAVGRLLDKDLEIPWLDIEANSYEEARKIVARLPKGYVSRIDRTYHQKSKASWRERFHEDYQYMFCTLQIRPTEIRECEWRKELINVEFDCGRCKKEMVSEVKHYNETLRDRHGNLRPIIEDWQEVRDAALIFISSVI